MNTITITILVIFLLQCAQSASLRRPRSHHQRHSNEDYEHSGDDHDNLIENSREDFLGRTSSNRVYSSHGHQESEAFQVMVGNPRKNKDQRRHHRRFKTTDLPGLRMQDEISFPSQRRDATPDATLQRLLFSDDGTKSQVIPLAINEYVPDNCTAKPFKQVLSHPGCNSETIDNNFCYGQCNTYYVPDDESKFVGCAVCYPNLIDTVSVDLTCPGYHSSEEVRIIRKTVEIVRSCSCMACSTVWKNMLNG